MKHQPPKVEIGKPCERCGVAERIKKERFCPACKKIVKQSAPRDPKNELPATMPHEERGRKQRVARAIDNPNEREHNWWKHED